MITGNTILIEASKFPIKSVKISKEQNAEVIRTFPLKLQEGQNTLKIEGLPSSISFARPSGLSATARLDDFIFTAPVSGQALPARFTTSPETIRVLEVKQAALQSERAIKELESQLMLDYGKSLSGAYVAPGEMSTFLESFSAHGLKTIEEVTVLNEKIVEIQRQIDAERAVLALKAGATDGYVMAMINADSDVDTSFTLTYLVKHCEWKPFYELHATMKDGKPLSSISLHYLAEIKQSTGEDWGGAEIILSTTENNFTPVLLPRAPPLKIRPKTSPSSWPTSSLFGQSVQAPSHSGALFGGRGLGRGGTMPQTSGRSGAFPPPPYASTGTGAVFGSTPAPQPSTSSDSGGLFGSTTPAFGAAAAGGNTANQASGQCGSAPPPPPASGSIGLFGSTANVPQATNTGDAQDPLSHYFQNILAAGRPGESPAGGSGGANAHAGVSSDALVGEIASVVHESPLSVFFNVKGKPCIPSDGLKHRVSLAVLPLTSHISYVTIPREDPTVFLQCAVKNTSEYRLLSGPISVIVDGGHVSAAMMENDIRPGEKFECTLGADVSMKVTYTRTSKTVFSVASSFAEATDTTVYNTRISVANKHGFDIADLVVRDRLPTCDDTRARVLLRQPAELGDAKDGEYLPLESPSGGLKVGWEKLADGKGGEKEGKFEWRWNVKSGESVELKAEYEVKVPKGASWVIQPQFF